MAEYSSISYRAHLIIIHQKNKEWVKKLVKQHTWGKKNNMCILCAVSHNVKGKLPNFGSYPFAWLTASGDANTRTMTILGGMVPAIFGGWKIPNLNFLETRILIVLKPHDPRKLTDFCSEIPPGFNEQTSDSHGPNGLGTLDAALLTSHKPLREILRGPPRKWLECTYQKWLTVLPSKFEDLTCQMGIAIGLSNRDILYIYYMCEFK